MSPLVLAAGLLAVRVASAHPSAATVSQERAREIVQVRGDLYRVQDGEQATVFLVTPEGILVGDPLNTAAARWLKSELASRFPDLSVRYVVQTYPSFERAGGGLIYLPDAIIVGHERFNATLQGLQRTLPESVAALDLNHNKRLDPDELAVSPSGAELLAYDQRGDGAVSPGEIWGAVAQAKRTYRTRVTITLGGKRIEIVNPEARYAADTTAILFPEERVLFSPASPLVTAGSFSFDSHNIRNAMAWAHAVAPLQFDTLISGHGEVVTRAEFDALVAYLDDLRSGVVEGYRAGWSIRQIQAIQRFDKYRGTPHDAARSANISAIYNSLRVVETDIQATATAQWFSSRGSYCASFNPCDSGGIVPGGTVGMRVAVDRVGAIFELSSGGQYTSQRQSKLYDDAFAHRSTRGSLLLLRGGLHRNERSIDLLLGPSITFGNSSGVIRVKEGFAPFAGRHPLDESGMAFGITAGINAVVPVGSRLTIVVPVRMTMTPNVPNETWPGRFDLQAGVGISVSAYQAFK